MFDGPRDLTLERLWASPLITQTVRRRKGTTGREMSCIWPPEESYIDINPVFINDPQFIWAQFSERDSIDSSKPSHKQLQTIIIIKCSENYITHQQQIVVRNSRVNMNPQNVNTCLKLCQCLQLWVDEKVWVIRHSFMIQVPFNQGAMWNWTKVN